MKYLLTLALAFIVFSCFPTKEPQESVIITATVYRVEIKEGYNREKKILYLRDSYGVEHSVEVEVSDQTRVGDFMRVLTRR